MKHELFLLPVFVVAVVWLTLGWRGTVPATASEEWLKILTELRQECDPDNPEADYSWAQVTLPTERKREALLQHCRLVSAGLLPEVREREAGFSKLGFAGLKPLDGRQEPVFFGSKMSSGTESRSG